jgi:hypothetical protein
MQISPEKNKTDYPEIVDSRGSIKTGIKSENMLNQPDLWANFIADYNEEDAKSSKKPCNP